MAATSTRRAISLPGRRGISIWGTPTPLIERFASNPVRSGSLGRILQKGHNEVDAFETDETDPQKFLDVNDADPAAS